MFLGNPVRLCFGIDLGARLPLAALGAAGPLQTVFERADDREILVDPVAIRHANLLAQLPGIVNDRVEEQLIALAGTSLRAARAKKALEDEAWIDLPSQRCG